MTDTQCAETPLSDHVARFWRHLESETVRILVDLKRVVGTDAPDGPIVYWDSATFSDDVAKALVAERAEIARLTAQLDDMRAFVGHVVIAAGGSVAIPMGNLRRCRYPKITREDRSMPDDILLTAALDEVLEQSASLKQED